MSIHVAYKTDMIQGNFFVPDPLSLAVLDRMGDAVRTRQFDPDFEVRCKKELRIVYRDAFVDAPGSVVTLYPESNPARLEIEAPTIVGGVDKIVNLLGIPENLLMGSEASPAGPLVRDVSGGD